MTEQPLDTYQTKISQTEILDKLADKINRPLTIGNRTIPNRLLLAPMTELGHIAFRHLLDELGGCGLMFSEMCSAARIPKENRDRSAYFRWRDEEADRLVIQILGSDPRRMAEAAVRIEAEGLLGVDINLGCSVREICKYNQGAALLKVPEDAVWIVKTVRKNIQCPLFVKFRTGWVDDVRIPVEMAKRLEDAGADALTFHPRVAPDVRTRPPRWEYIGAVKAAVSIPVFGNGDVFDAQDCLRMLQSTGCDGIALGRIAIARPWLFAKWAMAKTPDPTIHYDTSLRLLDLVTYYFEPKRALRRYKRYAAYLAANFTFGNTLYNRIRNIKEISLVKQVLIDFFANNPTTLKRPNMNFF